MANPFEQIDQPQKEVPKELKSKVMHDIAIAKLFMEIAELFSYNIGYIIESVNKKRRNK